MKYLFIIGINLIIIGVSMILFTDMHFAKADELNNNLSLYTSISSIDKKTNTVSSKKIKLDTLSLILTNAGILPKPVENVVPGLSNVVTASLETQHGNVSAYGPDCVGCSGHLGGGFDATLGNYVYNDSTYGNVRIVAGDPIYPYGTIIRISNTKMGDFNAIVLDRGGDIGIGRRFLFDLLFSSEAEANSFGTSYNVTVDVLRYGY